MKTNLFWTVSLVSAFSICNCLNIPDKGSIQKGLLSALDIKIHHNVGLPEDITPVDRIKSLLTLSPKANLDVISYVLQNQPEFTKLLVGKKKVNEDGSTAPEISKLQADMVKDVFKNKSSDPDPIPGYNYFGNKEFSKILGRICSFNPFFTAALTAGEGDNYLELKAFSNEPASATDSLYLQIMREMKDPSHRINTRFNLDMTVDQITVYNEKGEERVIDSTNKKELDYYASGVLYNLFYFASTIHANIHILHYLMTAGIKSSTSHNKAFAAWADPYDDNIAVKHLEVAALLFKASRGGKPFPTENQEAKLLTGSEGFGGNPNVLIPLRKLLCAWGRCKSSKDYLNNFIWADLISTAKNPEKLIEKAGLLTEFLKHVDNVDPFAQELSDAMKKYNPSDHALAEKKLKEFMSECGDGVSDIDSISSWVKLMSCTGLTHGGTLSYSRMALVPEVMRWRKINESTWSGADATLMGAVFGTIEGITRGKHVFSDKMPGLKNALLAKEVNDVLAKFDKKADTLKLEYQKKISAQDDFKDFGWIMTDFCVDCYDGKQGTLTTYI